MKIAYIISAYKLPEQLVRLVKRLNTDDTSFFIHIDKKAKREIFTQAYESLKPFRNVFFLKRHVCKWGDFGHVRATLKGIRQAMKQEIKYDYFYLITGQDYPIKSNRQIQEFLENSDGQSYIEYSSSIYLPKHWYERISYWHINPGKYYLVFPRESDLNSPILNYAYNHLVKSIPYRRKLPLNFEPYFGSSYWCLSNECIKYVYDFLAKNKHFEKFFKYVNIPDEIFFQTIILNSPLKVKLIDNGLMYIDFSAGGRHPAILTKENFDKLMDSSDLFARKFDFTIDPDILDMIDKVII